MHTPATRQTRVAGNGDGAPRADAHAVPLAPQSASNFSAYLAGPTFTEALRKSCGP